MLIGPGRTAMHAPIAIIDPHVAWYDAFRFYELRIYTPEYNASGVTILGFPLPSLGHSRYCSVAMTTGGPDTSDIFEEEINPANPKQYRYDAGWRDFNLREVTIAVKNEGKVENRHVTIVSSHHGPIVARKNGKAYAMALPYENEVGLTDQFYQMFTARNLAEMKQALSHLQLMSQNIMVATVQGDIYYLRNGRVPIRPRGVDPGRPIPGNLGQRVAGNSPDVRPAPDREPALRLDAELQLLARGDDEPRPARAEPVRRPSLPLQRISLSRLAPAGRDGDRPARGR